MGQLDEDDFTENAAEESANTTVADEATEVEQDTETQTEAQTEAPTEQLSAEEAEAAAKAEAEAKAKAEAAAKAKAELEHATQEFVAAVEAAVTDEGVDSSTGTIPDGLVSGVTKAYAAVPAKGRRAIKDFLQEKMQECMTEGVEDPSQFIRARSYLDLLKVVQAHQGAAKPELVRPPADPTEALLARVVPALLAAHLIIPDEGVASDWTERANAKALSLADQVKTYREYLIANKGKEGDERAAEPEVDALVLAAARLAQGKATARKVSKPKSDGTPRVSSGVRRDVGAHIAEYFAGKPVGHWATVSEIANFDSAEYGNGQDHPSSGAVSARLYPKSGNCTLEGVAPEARDKKGAVKTV
jgi:hypothetical protein